MRSGILMGLFCGIGAAFSGPSTLTDPLSAPPSTTCRIGFTLPAGMAMGLSMTDFLNCTVRS
ncbi:hypothetical protein ASE41_21380 [Streptomyces sp. Root264]|nr:hypothetical protein ASE41_21380 [Streptomyces sp. Root264]